MNTTQSFQSKPSLHDQIFFDKFHACATCFSTVYIRNFRQVYFDKCMCSKAGLSAFEQMHLTHEICQRKFGCVKGA